MIVTVGRIVAVVGAATASVVLLAGAAQASDERGGSGGSGGDARADCRMLPDMSPGMSTVLRCSAVDGSDGADGPDTTGSAY